MRASAFRFIVFTKKGDTKAVRRTRAASAVARAPERPTQTPSEQVAAALPASDPRVLFKGVDTSAWVRQDVEDALEALELGGAWNIDATPLLAEAWIEATR